MLRCDLSIDIRNGTFYVDRSHSVRCQLQVWLLPVTRNDRRTTERTYRRCKTFRDRDVTTGSAALY